VALCQGQRDSKGRRRLVGSQQDDDEEDDEEEEEEVEGVRRRPRGEGGTAPTWGETISSLNWRTAQWKLKLEGDRRAPCPPLPRVCTAAGVTRWGREPCMERNAGVQRRCRHGADCRPWRRVKRSVTRRGATTLEAVLVGAKNTVDGVRDLGDRIFVSAHTSCNRAADSVLVPACADARTVRQGQGDREFPLYKGEDD
jgi:hypothetical protein